MSPISFFIVSSLAFVAQSQCPDGWSQSFPMGNRTKCYKVVNLLKTWFDAELYCMNAVQDGHLTSISSAFENAFIHSLVSHTPDITTTFLWVGANDFAQNGTFTWTDGSPFSYSNWDQNQPNLAFQCGSTDARGTGLWTTEDSPTENNFICQTYLNSVTTTTAPPQSKMTDCYDWLHVGKQNRSGIYTIQPDGIEPFDVYCDMETDGGGWTLFQRHQDDTLVFYNRGWSDYKNGFNNGLEKNMWLGLDRIHILSTKDANVSMRTDIWGNRNPAFQNSTTCSPNGYWYATYGFMIDDEAASYRLHVTREIAGNLSDLGDYDELYIFNNNALFETIDRGTNPSSSTQWNCVKWGNFGPWWYLGYNLYGVSNNWCGWIHPNGVYAYTGEAGFNYRRDPIACIINPVRSELKLRKNTN